MNIGYWLLEQALASRSGMDYETLLRTRILDPLDMKNTAVTVSPQLKAKDPDRNYLAIYAWI